MKAEDLPKAFTEIRKLVAPPTRPKQDRERLEKQQEQLTTKLSKARRNLVHLDAEYIPDAQNEIRRLEAERAIAEEQLTRCKPATEKDINAVAVEVMHSLYSLAYCCRVLSREDDGKWDYYGSLESAAPRLVKRFLGRISHIVIHTAKRGRGKGTRHVFERGEIVFRGVGGVTGNLNPRPLGPKPSTLPN